MADPLHHSISSARQWGGEPDEYMHLHLFFDQSKAAMCHFTHRALLHHSMGIDLCIKVFGPTLTLSTGRVIPTRWVAEQHVREDLGRIPTMQDWFSNLRAQPWMNAPRRLSRELEANNQP